MATQSIQCSCLENPRDGGAWWAAIYGVAQSRTRLTRPSSSSRQYRVDGVEVLSVLVACSIPQCALPSHGSPHLTDTLVYELLDYQTKCSLSPVYLLLRTLYLD